MEKDMCVILIKDYDQAIPSDELLLACYNSNPHGLGVSIHKPNATKIDNRKGYMTIAAMRELLTDLRENHSDSFIAFHFRFTTSGSTSKGNCHPFPLLSDTNNRHKCKLTTELLKLEKFSSKMCFMHNGVLGVGDDVLDLSDTQLFVRDVLPSLIDYKDTKGTQTIDEQKTSSNLEEYACDSGSRFILMSVSANNKSNELSIAFAGSWLLHEGYLVSNTNFVSRLSRPYRHDPFSLFGRYGYDEDLDYDYDYDKDYEDNYQLCLYCAGEMVRTNLDDVLACADCGMLGYNNEYEVGDTHKQASNWDK